MSTELKPGETDKLWTISNIITLVRICLVPVFVVALITPWPTWFSIAGGLMGTSLAAVAR